MTFTSLKLVQNFKDIRSSAVDILNQLSSELKKLAEAQADPAVRTTFVDACKALEGSTDVSSFSLLSEPASLTDNLAQLDHESIVGAAKKVTDARKAIFEGISSGTAKIAKTYAA